MCRRNANIKKNKRMQHHQGRQKKLQADVQRILITRTSHLTIIFEYAIFLCNYNAASQRHDRRSWPRIWHAAFAAPRYPCITLQSYTFGNMLLQIICFMEFFWAKPTCNLWRRTNFNTYYFFGVLNKGLGIL